MQPPGLLFNQRPRFRLLPADWLWPFAVCARWVRPAIQASDADVPSVIASLMRHKVSLRLKDSGVIAEIAGLEVAGEGGQA